MTAAVRRRALGDASDIPAIEAHRIADAAVFASLADCLSACVPTRLWGHGGLRQADGIALEASTGTEGDGLIVVPRETAPEEIEALFARGASRPSLALCFLDYLTWLPEAEKNPLVAVINRLVNATPSARLAAYILDPEGRPRIVVAFTPPPRRPSEENRFP